MKEPIRIYCYYCKNIVKMTIVSQIKSMGPECENGFFCRYSFGKCPHCGVPLLAEEIAPGDYYDGKDLIETNPDAWSSPSRVWPYPEHDFPTDLPESVLEHLKKAKRFYISKDYEECMVNCWKVVEAICELFGSLKGRDIYEELRELKDRKIIDDTMFKWSLELKERRNKAAHNSKETASNDHTEYMLAFLFELCRYLFANKRIERMYDNLFKQPPYFRSGGPTPF